MVKQRSADSTELLPNFEFIGDNPSTRIMRRERKETIHLQSPDSANLATTSRRRSRSAVFVREDLTTRHGTTFCVIEETERNRGNCGF